MEIVSSEESSVATRRCTGQPLTTTSNDVAARPSGVLPAPRMTSRPPIVSHVHNRSKVGSAASVSVQPEPSTVRLKAANLASAFPSTPSTTQTF